MLTAGRLREVLSYDGGTGEFRWNVTLSRRAVAGKVAGGKDAQGRILIRIDRKLHLAHRLAWLYAHGTWPAEVIDHINGDPSDNRLSNLREANHSQNSCNMRRHLDNKSGIKGVYFDTRKKAWFAQISHRGDNRVLGRFTSKEAAGAAYARASREIHGVFGRVE